MLGAGRQGRGTRDSVRRAAPVRAKSHFSGAQWLSPPIACRASARFGRLVDSSAGCRCATVERCARQCELRCTCVCARTGAPDHALSACWPTVAHLSGARAARPAHGAPAVRSARGEWSAVRFAAGTTTSGTPARRMGSAYEPLSRIPSRCTLGKRLSLAAANRADRLWVRGPTASARGDLSTSIIGLPPSGSRLRLSSRMLEPLPNAKSTAGTYGSDLIAVGRRLPVSRAATPPVSVHATRWRRRRGRGRWGSGRRL